MKSTPKSESHRMESIELSDDDLISVELFERVGADPQAPYDLFQRLVDGSYIQVLKKGEPLTQARLDQLRAHGNFSIRKSQEKLYLNQCDEAVSALIGDFSLPVSKKAEEVARYGTQTLDFLRRSGMGHKSMDRAHQFVSKMTAIVDQISVGSKEIKNILRDSSTLEHSIGVTTIAGLMLKNIGVVRAETFRAIGIACFLHDIGLFGQPLHMMDEEESKMTPDQLAVFREHPILGARRLAVETSIPPGVAMAVEQHHLRVNGKGFPSSSEPFILSPVAEIVGIAETFDRLLMRARSEPTLDPVRAIEEIAKTDFSPTIASALLKTLQEA